MKHCLAILGALVSLMVPGLGEPADVASPSELVRIAGETPPALATAPRLSGAPSSDLPLTLTIVLNRTDPRGFDAFLRDVKDPRSPLFRRYLGQQELADRFGPSREAYDTVLEWLTRQGFALVAGSANRLTLTMQGSREQAQRAFAVRIDDYRVGGATFYANDRDPALPGPIASLVQAVVGLSDLARPVRVGSMKEIMEYQEQLKRDGLEDNLAYSCWLALTLANMPGISVPESLGSAVTDPAKDELLKAVGISYSLHQVSPAVTYLRYMCAADELNLLNRLALGLPIGGRCIAAVGGVNACFGLSHLPARDRDRLHATGRWPDGRSAGIRQFSRLGRAGLSEPHRPGQPHIPALAGRCQRRRGLTRS